MSRHKLKRNNPQVSKSPPKHHHVVRKVSRKPNQTKQLLKKSITQQHQMKTNTNQGYQYKLFTNLSAYQKFRKYSSKEQLRKYLKKSIFKVGYKAMLNDDNAGISDCSVLIKPLDRSTVVDSKGESDNPYICEITHVVNYEKCPRIFALSLMVIQCDGKGGCYIATANKYEAPDANEAERRRLIKHLQP